MSRKGYQPGPFRDRYGLGFRLPGGHAPLERHRTITAVCWDGDEAQFVNAAGLAVPCTALDGLPDVLHRASRQEFGTIIGEGQFAKSAHVLKSMEGAGTLRKWVTYYFELGESCLFFDDGSAWETFEQRMCADIAKEYQRQIDGLLEYRNANAKWLSGTHSEALERLERERQQALASERQHLANQRRQALEQDRQLGAWLRGELPTPPLLAGQPHLQPKGGTQS